MRRSVSRVPASSAGWPSADANRTWGRPWNSLSIGPKRDRLGALATAARQKPDMHFGFYTT